METNPNCGWSVFIFTPKKGLCHVRCAQNFSDCIEFMIKDNNKISRDWLWDFTVLWSISISQNVQVLSKSFSVGICLHTYYNQWIGMCVSSFYAECWSFSPCPFQQHWVGDRLSPVASLTKVRELRFALFNFTFLYSVRMMLYAFSFMERRLGVVQSQSDISLFSFLSSCFCPSFPPSLLSFHLFPCHLP